MSISQSNSELQKWDSLRKKLNTFEKLPIHTAESNPFPRFFLLSIAAPLNEKNMPPLHTKFQHSVCAVLSVSSFPWIF